MNNSMNKLEKSDIGERDSKLGENDAGHGEGTALPSEREASYKALFFCSSGREMNNDLSLVFIYRQGRR